MAYNGFLPENVINIGKIYSIHSKVKATIFANLSV